MEEDDDLRLNVNTPSSAPLREQHHMPKKYTKRRPQTYMEFLVGKLKEHPVRPSFWTRLIPLRHFFIFWVIKLSLSTLCFGLGVFFWRVVLPHDSFTASPTTVSTFLAGWMIMVALFTVGVFFTWVQVMISIFCCGKGLNIFP